jgi:hypothetical protein
MRLKGVTLKVYIGFELLDDEINPDKKIQDKPTSMHAEMLGQSFDELKGTESQTDDVCIVSMKLNF